MHYKHHRGAPGALKKEIRSEGVSSFVIYMSSLMTWSPFSEVVV